MESIIYFDNAATTFPKPRSVVTEVEQCIKHACGNPGRSSHALAMAAAEKIFACREQLAAFFGQSNPENVIFTLNATYALNMAIKGLIAPGDHVLISDMEHNAVLRPLEALKSQGVTWQTFPTVLEGRALSDDEICAEIHARMLAERPSLLICCHQSNLCSRALPVDRIGRLCRQNGILFLLDASQSAGHLPLSLSASGADVICAPGHKGLFGVQGCGFLLLSKRVFPRTLIEGGNGVDSLSPDMGELLPERLEAGTLPTPAIAGLCKGLQFLSALTPWEVHTHEIALFNALYDRLQSDSTLGATVYLPEYPGSVLLFSLRGMASEAVGQALAQKGICVRSGFHCSALGHRTLGTPPDGAVRVSFSLFNRKRELDRLIAVLRELRK